MGEGRRRWWTALVVVLAVVTPGPLPIAAEPPGRQDVQVAASASEGVVEAAVLRGDASSLALPAIPRELIEELRRRPAGLAVRERVAEWLGEERSSGAVAGGDDDAGSGEEHLAVLSIPRELVSVTPQGGLPDGNSYDPALSGDGRVAAFVSAGWDLVDGTTGSSNAFLRLRDGQETVWVSEEAALAGPADFEAAQPRVSADGRWVAYVGGTRFDGPGRVYLFDRVAGETVAVTDGFGSLLGGVSGDGRSVVFSSRDAGLVDAPLAAGEHVYLYDRVVGEVRLLSRNAAGEPLDGASYEPSISADGRWVAFVSWASNTLVGPPGGGEAVYLLDVATGELRWASRERGGGVVWLHDPAVSGDGRVVAFGDWPDVWVYDRGSDALEYGFPGQHPRISADGRFVSATNGYSTVVRFDRATGRIVRVAGGNDGVLRSFYQAISADGSSVAYHERVPRASGGFLDVVWVADLGENPPSLPAERARGAVGHPSPHARRPVGAQSDPVNSLTGEFVTSVVDVAQPGAGVPFSLERTYGSGDERVGLLGRGWSLSLSARLEVTGETVVFVAEDGLAVPFLVDADGVPQPEAGCCRGWSGSTVMGDR
jgi:Tol biopolymer transport system component